MVTYIRVLVAGTVTWQLRRLLLRMMYVIGHLLGPVSRMICVRTMSLHTLGVGVGKNRRRNGFNQTNSKISSINGTVKQRHLYHSQRNMDEKLQSNAIYIITEEKWINAIYSQFHDSSDGRLIHVTIRHRHHKNPKKN